MTVAVRERASAEGRRRFAEVSRLLERVLPGVTRWAHGRLPRRARARVETGDLVQEAAVGALEHLPDEKLTRPETLAAYIRTSIRNRIVDEIRRAGKVEVADNGSSEGAIDRAASPLTNAIDEEERARFRSALALLEERDQRLITGRIDRGLTYEQLALATGCPSPDAARVAARRAALRLAREVARMRGGLRGERC